MTKKEKEAEFKRNLVLEAAWNVFMEKGFMTSTMNDIAERSDYALGTIYKLFKNKEEIFVLLAKMKLEELRDIFAEQDFPSKDPIERIRDILTISINYFLKNIRMIQLFHFEPWAGDIEMAKSIKNECKEYFQSFSEDFIKMIASGIEQGYFRKLDPVKAHLAIKGMVNELFWDRVMRGEELNTDELVDEVMSFFLYGIVNKTATLNM